MKTRQWVGLILVSSIRMKKCLILTQFIFFVFSFNLNSQTKFLIKDTEGFDYILNVNVDGNKIYGFTRDKALFDYASKFNYRVIKLVSTLKHSEIIRFNGIINNNQFEGTYDFLFSSYRIEGNINSDSIHFSLFDKNNKLFKSLNGVEIMNHSKKDYVKLAKKIIVITEENIFNPKTITTKKWDKFKRKLIDASSKVSDDLEFQIGFFVLIRNFDFSHFYLVRDLEAKDIDETPSLNEIDKDIVVLKIGSFFMDKEKIKPLLDTIEQKKYKNLIIDLRDNPGGYFEPASLIANFITDEVFISGFFPTRKWHEEYNRLPNRNDIEKFNMINGDTVQTNSEYGFYISTKGTNKKFEGNIYFLVNRKTGSTAEALTIGAKEYNIAKIAGEKTAGGLLSVQRFSIDEDIILFVPVNDFISYNGYRVDQIGIKPDIYIKKGNQLEHFINMVLRSKRLYP